MCRARVVRLIIIVLCLLDGCSGGERRVDEGNRSGVLHFGNSAEPQDIDPHTTTGVPESHIVWALFEGLVNKHPETLQPVPGVAERWETSGDGKIYRFHLRRNAKWSNGDSITAEDFRWSWWRALQPKLGNEYAYMLYPIRNAEEFATGKLVDFSQVGVRVLDDYTLEVELKSPTPYFLQLIDHQSYYPVPRKALEKFGGVSSRFSKWTRPENAVTNGSFRLAEWKINRYVKVEKNPYYWNAENVKLNGVVFYPTENVATEERMFRSRQLHVTQEVPIDKVLEYKRHHPDELRLQPYLGSYYYMVNVTRPGLRDARVRRALAMAIDRETLTTRVLHGVFQPAYALTPPGTSDYTPPVLFGFDPAAARKLLAEAGYPNGEGFPKFEIMYNTNEQHRKIAVAVQQMWKQHLNIEVGIVNQEWKVYLDSRDELNYDIGRAAWIGDYLDPNTFIELWVTGGGNNDTGWSNARYDALVRKASTLTTQSERLATYKEAETILLQEMPIIPIYYYVTRHLVSPAVKGMSSNILDHIAFREISLESH